MQENAGLHRNVQKLTGIPRITQGVQDYAMDCRIMQKRVGFCGGVENCTGLERTPHNCTGMCG
eukprot:4680592-Lingulodinium_polyedra.AAC.1